MQSLAGKIVSTVTQTLEELNTNPTLANVIAAVKSAIQQVADALVFTVVEWAPQITVTVFSSLAPRVYDANSKVAYGIFVEPPIVETTPTS